MTHDPTAPCDISSLATEVRLACMRVSRRVRFESGPKALAPHLVGVLVRIDKGAATAAEIAQAERVTAPSMSRTVGHLVETGLVATTQDETDRRRQILSLTKTGAQALVEERARRDAWMAERLRGLSDEERDVLARATDILNQVVGE